eukprot:354208-Chlamydomonas_euryale.AAC.9
MQAAMCIAFLPGTTSSQTSRHDCAEARTCPNMYCRASKVACDHPESGWGTHAAIPCSHVIHSLHTACKDTCP